MSIVIFDPYPGKKYQEKGFILEVFWYSNKLY